MAPINSSDDVAALVERVRSGAPADTLEGHRLEFKSATSVKEELAKVTEAAVCFANADGGLLIVGVKDKPGGPEALVGAHASEDAVRRHLANSINPPLAADISLVELDGLHILAITVLRGVRVHATSDGHVRARFGKHCIPLEPSQIAALEADRVGYDPSAAPTDLAVPSADAAALSIAQEQVSRLPDHRAELAELSARDFLVALGVSDNEGRLNVAGRLLLTRGTDERATYQYRSTPGGPPAAVERLSGSMLLAFQRLLELIAARRNLSQLSLPTGQQLDLEDFPQQVVREALANAFVHRLLDSADPISVEHSPELLVITSPGPLVNGVSIENILTTPSRPRNRTLAQAFRKLGLIEELGTGIPRMYREMVRSGKQPPTIEATPTTVRVALLGGFGNKALARYVAGLPPDERNDTDALLTLLHLCSNATVNVSELAPIVQRGSSETAQILTRLSNAPALMVEPTRESIRYRDPNYRLRAEVLESLGTVVGYKRRTSDEIDRKIIRHVGEYGRVTNQTVRNLLEIGTPRASAILRRLVDKQVLARTSEAARGPAVEYGPGANFSSETDHLLGNDDSSPASPPDSDQSRLFE